MAEKKSTKRQNADLRDAAITAHKRLLGILGILDALATLALDKGIGDHMTDHALRELVGVVDSTAGDLHAAIHGETAGGAA